MTNPDLFGQIGKLFRMSDQVMSHAGGMAVAIGRVALRDLVRYFEKPAGARPFDVYTAERIYPPGDEEKTGVPQVESGLQVTPERVASYQDHITALDVILCPQGTKFTDAVLEKATADINAERTRQNRTALEKAESIQTGAMDVYRELKKVSDSLRGVISQNQRRLDAVVVESMKVLNGAISTLYVAIYEASEELLGGEGRIIACLHGIKPPTEEEAALVLKMATTSLMCAYQFGIADPFALSRIFLAALLQNCSLWGERRIPKGHEAMSAGIIKMMRAQGCDLPGGLEMMVSVHGDRDLTNKYAYLVDISAPSTHTDEAEIEIGRSFLVKRESAGLEKEISAELRQVTTFQSGIFQLANAGIKSIDISVRMLSEHEFASLIILALVEEFYEKDGDEETEIGIIEKVRDEETRAGIISDMLAKVSNRDQINKTTYGKTFIALANTLNIFITGMIVELHEAGGRKAMKRQAGLDGCRGVVVAVDSLLGPVLNVFSHRDAPKIWFPWKYALGTATAEQLMSIVINDATKHPHRFLAPLKAGIRERVFAGRVRVIGFADPGKFQENFGHIAERLVPVLHSYFEERERQRA